MRLSIIAINLIALGFIALAVAQTIASWSSDLVERRRGVRVFIVAAAALYGGLNAIPQILWSGGGTEIANAVNSAVLAAVVAAISFAMMRVDGADLFPVAPAVEAGDSGCSCAMTGRRPETGRCADAADGGRAHLPSRQHHHRHAGDEARNSRIPVAAADQPAARLSQFQCLPQRSPDRGGQGRARRSRARPKSPSLPLRWTPVSSRSGRSTAPSRRPPA